MYWEIKIMTIDASGHPRNIHLALQYRPTTLDVEMRTVSRITETVPVSVTNTLPLAVAFGGTDAFGRQRVAAPFTLFDSFHRFQDNQKNNTYTASGGNTSFDSNAGCVNLNVSGSNGSLVYRETQRVFAYQPGKSLLIMQTFCMNPAKDNLRQRIGYFGDYNGFYLQLTGSQLSLVKRSSVTGSLVETTVNQQNWNVDTLGAGALNPSGITLDITKTQILWTDMEWLGVGSVRMGFVIDGAFVLCHQFNHANVIGTTPYITTACLPTRKEIENLSETGSSSAMCIICETVISEGGYELRGDHRAIAMTLDSPYNTGTPANTIRPLITIRLKSTRLDAIVLPKSFGIMPVDNLTGRWYLIEAGTTSGGSGTWINAGIDSSVEYKMDATTITGGTVRETGFLQAQAFGGTRSSFESSSGFKYQLERDSFIPQTFEFTLALAITTTNKDIYADMSWEELTA
jgi:hypothetical protein